METPANFKSGTAGIAAIPPADVEYDNDADDDDGDDEDDFSEDKDRMAPLWPAAGIDGLGFMILEGGENGIGTGLLSRR